MKPDKEVTGWTDAMLDALAYGTMIAGFLLGLLLAHLHAWHWSVLAGGVFTYLLVKSLFRMTRGEK